MLNLLKHSKLSSSFFNRNRQISKKFSTVRHENPLKGYINYARSNSHKFSEFNPLKLRKNPVPYEFLPETWGLSEIEKVEDYPLDNYVNSKSIENLDLIKDLKDFIQKTYLNSVGVEFNHIECEAEKKWLYENFENAMHSELEKMELINAFKVGYPTEIFENYLNIKFPSFKRYSGEGINSTFMGLFSMLSECSLKSNPVEEVVIDMQHRGRLNFLPFIMDYPLSLLFHKLSGKRDVPKNIEGIDDVLSHVSASNQKVFYSKGNINEYKSIVVTNVHNPSHLEAAAPVSMGKSKAKINDYGGDKNKVLNIQIHGDAAISGQGLIYEMLNFSKTPNSDIGGAIHLISNNQIGYTTEKVDGMSTKYCSDIFKTFDYPILHVNADDVVSLIKTFKFALSYKLKYHKDIVIDVVGYRKYGHNEVDEPGFTQPLMYKKIRSRGSYIDSFKKYLLESGIITNEQVTQIENKIKSILESEFKKAQNLEITKEMITSETFKGNKSLTKKWLGMKFPQFCDEDSKILTGIDLNLFKNIVKESVKLPENFKLHPRLKNFVDTRLDNLEKGQIDWPTAEIAAFGSLLNSNYNVRISGQDVTRGTFSQRHIGLFDQETNQPYFPFKSNNSFLPGRLEVNNTILSEFSTMLLEYGYSLENPRNMVIWEAQFGDFFNGAQIAIDQFIATGESKWLRQSGLTLLLPHGFDSAGPEHSSCRIERFLQNTLTDGIDVNSAFINDHRSTNFCFANITTSSNYFHILRRQMLREYRKPLVIAAPKIGLRHPKFFSDLSQFASNSKFQPIIVNKYGEIQKSKNVIFCSGQIFLEIQKIIQSLKDQKVEVNTLVIRIEELCPFPEKLIENELSNLDKSTNIFWVQEEGINAGAFTYSVPHLRRISKKLGFNCNEVKYIGRKSEVAANGCSDDSSKEFKEISQKIKNIL